MRACELTPPQGLGWFREGFPLRPRARGGSDASLRAYPPAGVWGVRGGTPLRPRATVAPGSALNATGRGGPPGTPRPPPRDPPTLPGGRGVRDRPGGHPGTAPGRPACTFFWVFNNSPSRDKDGTEIGTDFSAVGQKWPRENAGTGTGQGWDRGYGGYGGGPWGVYGGYPRGVWGVRGGYGGGTWGVRWGVPWGPTPPMPIYIGSYIWAVWHPREPSAGARGVQGGTPPAPRRACIPFKGYPRGPTWGWGDTPPDPPGSLRDPPDQGPPRGPPRDPPGGPPGPWRKIPEISPPGAPPPGAPPGPPRDPPGDPPGTPLGDPPDARFGLGGHPPRPPRRG